MYIDLTQKQSKGVKHSQSLNQNHNQVPVFIGNNQIQGPKVSETYHQQGSSLKPSIIIQGNQLSTSPIGEVSEKEIGHEGKQYQVKHIENFSYVTSQQIGLGFSSKVYKGRNQKNNQHVAIKVIDLKGVKDQLHTQFLNQEVLVLQTILQSVHPNLLKLEGVFKTKNNLYIVTEFCEGKDMAKLLRKKKKLTESEAQSVMKQLLSGYNKLYELKIVHRDLKLANIFIKKGNVKIADFGFATSAQHCQQKFSYNVGSPYYMAPETLKRNIYSNKSDLWGLGVIAYQLVHGKLPWKDKNDSILFQLIMNHPISTLIEQELNLSENYINFIKACLTIEMEKRISPENLKDWPWHLATDYVQGAEDKTLKVLTKMPFIVSGTPKRYQIGTERHIYSSSSPLNEIRPSSYMSEEHALTNAINEANQLSGSGSLTGLFRKPHPNFKKDAPMLVAKKNQDGQIIISNQNQPYSAQQAILAQLHYCRFLTNLHEEIEKVTANNSPLYKPRTHNNLINDKSNIPNLQVLKQSIRKRILNKINTLLEMSHTGNNILNINGFKQLHQSNKWHKLKDVIQQYHSKFRQQLDGRDLNPELDKINIEQCLVITIKTLKVSLSSNLTNARLTELLTFYLQVLGLQKSNNPNSFAKVAKLDLLGSKKLFQSVAIQRLLKKLQNMGL